MPNVENVNYKYLGMAVVFLIMTYYYLSNTKSDIYLKKINDKSDDKIYIMTSKGKISMDNNVFEKHMNRMKKNIVDLQHNFSKKNCTELKKYIDDAKNQTKKYIDLNKNNIGPDFCNLNNSLKMIDNNILKERELLKNKMDGKYKTELDDGETDDVDEIRYNILELLIDIDIIMFLVRSSVCRKGEIDLTSLDNIMISLYEKKCKEKFSGSDLSQNNSKEGFDTQESYEAALSIMTNNSPEKISNSAFSQDLTDSDIRLKRSIYNQTISNQGETILTHANEEEFIDIDQINENLYKSLNYSDVIKWNKNYDIYEQGTRDENGRSSLLQM
jgi:hypothetical protein